MWDYVLKNSFRLWNVFSVLGKKGIQLIPNPNVPLPRLLRETFEELGVTYIKLGQFIASAPSFFPEEYVMEFQKCLDQTEPVPFSVIEKILVEEFRKPLSSIFDSIEEKPIASASIAQVHGAVLKDGTDVVLKIQKPGVKDVILTDTNFLYFAAKLFEFLVPEVERLSLSELVEDLQKSMINECDFILEAKHTKDFRRFLEKYQIPHATVPKIYDHLTTSRVITMERLYGVPFWDFEAVKKIVPDPKEMMIKTLTTWFLSLVENDFFHADLHSGNLMVLFDGRVAFIDFGIVGRISQKTWQGLQKIVLAMEAEPLDYLLLAEGLMQAGIAKQAISKDKFAQDLKLAFETLQQWDSMISEELTEEEINKKFLKIIQVAKENGIRFPREFGLILKQFLYFDKYLRTLAPDIRMVETMSSLE
ncbi:MAG: AarF/UbiB family protein [Leptospiraceae bacterium]|nr:AarF/UbiB family protein [Leptospiraceae bacterium]MDW7977127.1 AarF/UbiB family protein [Leptospiraceae bacterium]